MPKSRIDYWAAKFDANVARDKQVKNELETEGWRVIVIWECETKDPQLLDKILTDAMHPLELSN